MFPRMSDRYLDRLLKYSELKSYKSQYCLKAKSDQKKDEKMASTCEDY